MAVAIPAQGHGPRKLVRRLAVKAGLAYLFASFSRR
jgi:hypothetical protein